MILLEKFENFAHHLIVGPIKVRCPACHKLYQVETAAIYSHHPHFDCKACRTVFSFEFPPKDAENILTTVVSATQVSVPEPELKISAEPSLAQLWNRIFEDYDDSELHDDFIKRCQELEALPFAHLKYTDLKSSLGADDVCEKYLTQVQRLLAVKIENKVREPLNSDVNLLQFFAWLRRKPLLRILYWSPLIATLAFTIFGFSHGGYRNMIGVGAAVAFLSYGLITLFRGRIHLSDFID